MTARSRIDPENLGTSTINDAGAAVGWALKSDSFGEDQIAPPQIVPTTA